MLGIITILLFLTILVGVILLIKIIGPSVMMVVTICITAIVVMAIYTETKKNNN